MVGAIRSYHFLVRKIMTIDWFFDVESLWSEAWHLGNEAKKAGRPRECNLSEDKFITPRGSILKVYKSAWEQGYDNRYGDFLL